MFAAHAPLFAIPILPSAAIKTANVSTGESTTSTTYTNLTTTTDTVTVTVGSSGSVLVFLESYQANDYAVTSRITYVSYDISGANTKAPDDTRALLQQNVLNASGACFLETGLTSGSTTFKMKYKVSSGTGTFYYRHITVIPL